jgi:hypothetical protein
MKVNLCVGQTCMKDVKSIVFSTKTVSELDNPESNRMVVKVRVYSDVATTVTDIATTIQNIHTINEKITTINDTISLFFTMSDDVSISLRITDDLELVEIQKENNTLYTEIRDAVTKVYNNYLDHLREGN